LGCFEFFAIFFSVFDVAMDKKQDLLPYFEPELWLASPYSFCT
jgi:hypothetical protein